MIYILEDEKNICNLIAYSVMNAGYDVDKFYRPSDFWKAMKKNKPELIILDLMLPEEDGLSILKALRSDMHTENIPIIILTAMDDEYDILNGLDSGADDYITKPFKSTILVARIKAVLRRTKPEENAVYSYKEISINTSIHKVFIKDTHISLTLKEYELLLLLVKKQGRVLSRDYILGEIWGLDSEVESRNIDSHIRSIRAKLGIAGDHIKSIRGVGYCMGDLSE